MVFKGVIEVNHSKVKDILGTTCVISLFGIFITGALESSLCLVFIGAVIACVTAETVLEKEEAKQENIRAEKVKEKEQKRVEEYYRVQQKERERVKLNGEVKTYYTNGNVESICVYENDVLIAPVIRYNDRGELLNGEVRDGDTITSYKNGMKDGRSVTYVAGKIIIDEHWKNGERWGVPLDYYDETVKNFSSKSTYKRLYHRCLYNGNERPVSLTELDEIVEKY